jgi:hypothetical protein
MNADGHRPRQWSPPATALPVDAAGSIPSPLSRIPVLMPSPCHHSSTTSPDDAVAVQLGLRVPPLVLMPSCSWILFPFSSLLPSISDSDKKISQICNDYITFIVCYFTVFFSYLDALSLPI